jgi:DNA-directed RNA polymerase specialized sigma24 family protein
LAERCRAGDGRAWRDLAALFQLALGWQPGRRRGGLWREQVLEDAAQDVWCQLLEGRALVLVALAPGRGTLAAYLARLVRRRAEVLLRGERRRRRRERAACACETVPPAAEAGLAEQAQAVLPYLTAAEGDFLRRLLERAWLDDPCALSAEAVRQVVCRIRRKVRELAAADGRG